MNLYDEVSFKTSKIFTKKYSTSFSISVSFLPGKMRKAIYSLYGFVRVADEIVDTFFDSDQKRLLDEFEKDFYKAIDDGISTNPILHSFSKTVKEYNIPLSLIDSFLKSMKADLSKQIYLDESELRNYIYGSADVVGLMCLRVFTNGNNDLYKQLELPAMKLGSAFQKVNFLRDLKNDVELLNRVYFPDFNKNSFDENKKNILILDIENDFRDALSGIKRLPGKSQLAVLIAYTYYKKLLLKIKQTPAEKILSERIRIRNSYKIVLFGKAYVKYRLNWIQ
ncbi:MAG: phytoene/squalene synthase family protein [Candidatus Cloacimonetes bacterium]|nr:phytoene/squalene synthase family protein [Candidatus Cloacimonadota bacterium]